MLVLTEITSCVQEDCLDNRRDNELLNDRLDYNGKCFQISPRGPALLRKVTDKGRKIPQGVPDFNVCAPTVVLVLWHTSLLGQQGKSKLLSPTCNSSN